MAIVGVVLVTLSAATALNASVGSLDLRPSPFRVIDDHLSTIEHAHHRSRYLLPEAELPAVNAGDDGVQVRWRLKRIKVKVPLGAI